MSLPQAHHLIGNDSVDCSRDYPKNELKMWEKRTRDNTFALPQIINPYLALVIVTFNLLGSVKKPIPIPSFDLTHEIII